MKITIESTSKIVTLEVGRHSVSARIWQGETESGIPVLCFITRIAPEILKSDPRVDSLTSEFERDLARQVAPRASVQAIPLRLII